jgi:hypothetical protein
VTGIPPGELTVVLDNVRSGVPGACERLTAHNARQCLVVTFHDFLGMTIPVAAEVLVVSPATVNGDWRLARAWLLGQLRGEDA